MLGSSSQRVLVLFAHPALEKSRVNRRLAAAALNIPGVTFHELYEAYPDFHILADREQELLAAHDTFVDALATLAGIIRAATITPQ